MSMLTLWLKCELSLIDPCVWMLNPRMVGLFCETVESFFFSEGNGSLCWDVRVIGWFCFGHKAVCCVSWSVRCESSPLQCHFSFLLWWTVPLHPWAKINPSFQLFLLVFYHSNKKSKIFENTKIPCWWYNKMVTSHTKMAGKISSFYLFLFLCIHQLLGRGVCRWSKTRAAAKASETRTGYQWSRLQLVCTGPGNCQCIRWKVFKNKKEQKPCSLCKEFSLPRLPSFPRNKLTRCP